MRVIQFLKDWTLPVAMLMGVVLYLVFRELPLSSDTRTTVVEVVGIVQPVLIFLMLFLTFCKIEPKDLKYCKWHLPLLLIQGGSFLALSALLVFVPHFPNPVLLEGLMLCLICPTATAAAVVTRKLGGSASNITTYTILINIVVSVLIPFIVPLLHPHTHLGFWASSFLILSSVFPLLLLPMVFAWGLRRTLPKLHQACCRYPDLAFYLWGFALMLAIAVTMKTLVESRISWLEQVALALISLVACVGQFALGWRFGARSDDRISAGQGLGQKNTVLAIWMGYTFFEPVTSLAAGFYMIWHNLVNTYQLRKKQLHQ